MTDFAGPRVGSCVMIFSFVCLKTGGHSREVVVTDPPPPPIPTPPPTPFPAITFTSVRCACVVCVVRADFRFDFIVVTDCISSLRNDSVDKDLQFDFNLISPTNAILRVKGV